MDTSTKTRSRQRNGDHAQGLRRRLVSPSPTRLIVTMFVRETACTWLHRDEVLTLRLSHSLHFKFEALTTNRLERQSPKYPTKALQQEHKLAPSASSLAVLFNTSVLAIRQSPSFSVLCCPCPYRFLLTASLA